MKTHQNYKKNFKLEKSWKNEKILVLIFAQKTMQIDLNPPQGCDDHFLSRKINFEIFRFLNLEKFQKFFKFEVKIWNFLTIFLKCCQF